ncbi:hypothetical protein [Paludibacterium yongneupense]|uniref:hypothetical protein n=1 Tax=Paludibacterium yongneupense TaxID=400061 RepID=UPI00048BAB4C|nr:hypothetical protein [Paludibacterium yongneupense]
MTFFTLGFRELTDCLGKKSMSLIDGYRPSLPGAMISDWSAYTASGMQAELEHATSPPLEKDARECARGTIGIVPLPGWLPARCAPARQKPGLPI